MFKRFLVSFLCATMLVNSISVSSYASELGELVVMEAESGEMTTEDVIEVANDIEESSEEITEGLVEESLEESSEDVITDDVTETITEDESETELIIEEDEIVTEEEITIQSEELYAIEGEEERIENVQLVDCYSRGNGTKSNPYTIMSASELYNLSLYMTKMSKPQSYSKAPSDFFDGIYFQLGADIYLNPDSAPTLNVWRPIDYFYGHFDGNNHVIHNLYLRTDNTYTGSTLGLFGNERLNSLTWGGEWRNWQGNVSFENITIDGVIVEIGDDKSMSSVPIGAIVAYAGGSRNEDYGFLIDNCKLKGKMDVDLGMTTSAYLGGLIGQFQYCDVTNCTNEAEIVVRTDDSNKSNNRSYFGAIASTGDGSLIKCTNAGSIKYFGNASYFSVAGIVGDFRSQSEFDGNSKRFSTKKCRIENCVNEGEVYSNDEAAGIFVSAEIVNNILNCRNSGVVEGERYAAGIGKSLKAYSVFTSDYGIGDIKVTECSNEGNIIGAHASGLFYSVTNVVLKDCDNSGELTLEESLYDSSLYAAGLVDMFYISSSFAGKTTPKGITIMEDCANSGIIDASFVPPYGSSYGCGLVYKISGDSGVKLVNCSNRGNINSSGYASGLIDTCTGVSLYSCNNEGNLTGESELGGLVKSYNVNGDSEIVSCYNKGNINCVNVCSAGGLVDKISARNTDTINIKNCFNYGNILTPNYLNIGGLVGVIETNYYSPSINIIDCYSIGTLSGKPYYGNGYEGKGAIIGSVSGGIVSIDNVYYSKADLSAYGRDSSDTPVNATKCFAKVDSELKNQATYSGWDFESVWEMGTGDYPYPILREYINVDPSDLMGDSGNIHWEVVNGCLNITGTGDWERTAQNTAPWNKAWKIITSAKVNVTGTTDASGMFYGLAKMKTVDLEHFDTSQVTTMAGMFENCAQLTELDLSKFSTSSVTSMTGMFKECSALEKVNLSSFETTNVTSMKNMFYACRGLLELDLSSFDTVNVRSMEGMFFDCSGLKELDLSGINMQSVDNAFGMLSDCANLMLIKSPLNLSKAVSLPNPVQEGVTYTYYAVGSGVCAELPMSSNDSKMLYREMTRKGEFSYKGNDKARHRKYAYEYSDNMLRMNPGYNHDMAQMSIRLAMAGFDFNGSREDYEQNDNIKTYGDENVYEFMSELGFAESKTGDERDNDSKYVFDYPKSTHNTIGYAIGSKNIIDNDGEETSVILVVVRGAGYNAEWGGNALVGWNTDHDNFRHAANTVREAISQYVSSDAEKHGLKAKKKIWITGYSRAAAVSNLLAADLINGIESGFNENNVYAYCFECPKNTTSIISHSDKYKGICNIVNPSDVVTYVAPKEWGFTRYGKDYPLPSRQNTSIYDDLNGQMREKYEMIISYDKSNAPGKKLKLGDETYLQTYYTNEVVHILCSTITRDDYVVFLQDSVAAILQKKQGNVETESEFSYEEPSFAQLIGSILEIKNEFDVLNKRNIKNKLESAERQLAANLLLWSADNYLNDTFVSPVDFNYHTPEMCLAWMDTLDDLQEATYFEYIINCPIDVEVYNGDKLVAKIENDVVSEIVDGYECVIDSSGQKVVMIPGDANSDIHIKASDNGEMTVTSVKYEGIDEVAEVVSYQNIQIAKDDEFSSHLEMSEENYALYDKNNNKIEADLCINGDEIIYYAVNIDNESDMITTYGGGSYLPGEFAKVTAEPISKGVTFEGWYDEEDNLVSEEAEYRFLVERDITLTARFTTPSNFWMIDIADQTYTGADIKPEIKVYAEDKLLTQGTDYTVTYARTKAAYTLSEEDENFNFAKAPTITVTGKGNYSGKIVKTFVINPREISECEVADIVVLENGKLQKSLPVVTTVVNGKKVTLKNNSDYTLSYPDERDGAYQNEGEYEIVITGKGNYIGTKSVTETIAANKTLISKVSVKAIPTQTYTGKPIEPVITVSNGKTPMTLGFDYDVEYRNHTDIGTATVVITGKGSYIGTKTVSFKIVGTAITKCAVDYTNAFIYSGSAITPETNANFKVYIKATKAASEIPLTKGKDFEITYQNNVKVGTGTMIITGINGYSGILKKTFKINPFDIANDTNGRVTVEPIGSVAYQKGGVKPVVNVKDTVSGDTLVAGKDYSVAYVNNKKVNDGSDARTCPTVKITGKGNYKGTRSVIFKIINNDIINTNVTATDFVYANKPGVCKTKVVVTDSDGTKLVAGVDYDKNITLTYSDGTAVDLVNDIIDVGTEIKATVKALPTSPYYSEGGFNENYATFRCVKNDLAKATVKIPAQTYTGKAIELSDADITVAFGKEEPLVAGTDYKVVGYTNNTNKGTAKVTLEGIGNYGGTKTVSFSITQRSMNYTIVYDKNADDAIGTMKDSSIATGTKLTRCAYKRDGDTFIGWNTKKDGSGISYNDGETFRIKSIFQIFGTKEVLYAQWASGTHSE